MHIIKKLQIHTNKKNVTCFANDKMLPLRKMCEMCFLNSHGFFAAKTE